MRLPRRVPWAHVSELEQVCLWIYADEEDLEAKTLAVNRLSAWKAVTSLPHALDSALAILVACVLDASYRDALPTTTALGLRQTYATAIIRMVNGFVDPLQSGAYARSIAAIATQLGLPSWLVELRHAATHEDLPSLELLRGAGRESLSWLFRNYFQPTLNSSAPTSSPPLSLRPVEPLLMSYKRLMKVVTRDVSLRKRNQSQIDATIRDIERWISETRVSAELAAHPLGSGFDGNSATLRVDIKEKWALESLCDALFRRGVIVPASKKKCRGPAEPFFPTKNSLALWTPLFVQLCASHAAFPPIFTSRVISVLLEDIARLNNDTDVIELDSKHMPRDTLYNEYLARWAAWATRTWMDDLEHGVNLKKEFILQVAPAFVPGHSFGIRAKVLFELLHAISVGSKELEECVQLLSSTVVVVPQPWKAHDLVNMEERLQILMANEHQTAGPGGNGFDVSDGATRRGGTLAAGWRLLDDRGNWSPCPIGVYYSESQ